MIFNGGMTIWIFAIVVVAALALAGWRQGAIRAAFFFVDILFAALLAVPLGKLFHPLLPHLGATNPFTAWALAPVVGFIVASIPLMVGAQFVHHRVEHYYKYRAGDLREALWQRLNTRLGICLGVLNGVIYFILISFFIFNLTYTTTQVAADPASQPFMTRAVNSLGDGLAATGFSQTASAVGTLPPEYYKLADLAGLLMQNPPLGPRLAEYPGLISLWHRDELQSLVGDSTILKAPGSGTPLGQIMDDESVQAFLANKGLVKVVEDSVLTNLDDLVPYLKTGVSAKYGKETILGHWVFNAGVTLAWLRQEQPKMARNELNAIRALWSEAYAPTKLLLTGDNQVFVTKWPKFVPPAQPNQPPFQGEDCKGDWSRDGTNYSLHLTPNGADKYLNATTDGLRLRIKDGHSLLIFDHVD
jgi:hypothetical protein